MGIFGFDVIIRCNRYREFKVDASLRNCPIVGLVSSILSKFLLTMLLAKNAFYNSKSHTKLDLTVLEGIDVLSNFEYLLFLSTAELRMLFSSAFR